MKLSSKYPIFLIKSIFLSLIFLTFTIFFLIKISPQNLLIIVGFLFVLTLFLSHFLSIVYFFVKNHDQQRVWYLKNNEFSNIYATCLFISLFVSLSLLLKYVEQLNVTSTAVLIVVLGGSYWLSVKN